MYEVMYLNLDLDRHLDCGATEDTNADQALERLDLAYGTRGRKQASPKACIHR